MSQVEEVKPAPPAKKVDNQVEKPVVKKEVAKEPSV